MANHPTPSKGEPASARLQRHRQRVLERWEERARQELPGARVQPPPELLDSLPDTLDALIRILSAPSPTDALKREEALLSSDHGRHRARTPALTLDQVVHEYHLLRKVLFEVLEPLEHDERELVLDVVQIGARNAVREFARVRDGEREQARADLQALHDELDQRVRERTSALSHSEGRFRHLVEVVKDYAIFTLDPHGCITSWNTGCRRMKGYTEEEAVGRHFSMLYPEEGRRRDEPMGHLRTAVIEGRFRGEGVRLRKNGELFMADVSITPMYDGAELRGFAKVVQDLTERRRLVQEIDLTRTNLDRMRVEAEYRERFVATLTHDLRSPLSAAKYAAQLIGRAPEDPDKVRTWALRISESVDRTDRMISALLDASRIQAGEPLAVTFEPCDATQLAQALCDELSTRHGDRFAIQSVGDTRGCWDPEALRRILDNLLSNALKYGTPSTPVTVRVRRVDDRVLLSVHNEGTLIPKDEQDKLFQPFHRAAGAQASQNPGWGLGLTLVKGLAEAHHGVVKVESYPTVGTTFTVDLPVDARHAEAEPDPPR